MEISELIEKAEKKVAGTRALARAIPWDPGALAAGKRSGKVPPWVAGRLAQICDLDPEPYERKAAADASRSTAEKHYWASRIQQKGRIVAIMLTTFLVSLGAHSPRAEAGIVTNQAKSGEYTLCVHP